MSQDDLFYSALKYAASNSGQQESSQRLPLNQLLAQDSKEVQTIIYSVFTEICDGNEGECIARRDPKGNEKCLKAHYSEQLRRCPFTQYNQLRYLPQMCVYAQQKMGPDGSPSTPNTKQNGCPNQDACTYAHSLYEAAYHPLTYKTVYCMDFFQLNQCKSSFCSQAHSQSELRSYAQEQDYNTINLQPAQPQMYPGSQPYTIVHQPPQTVHGSLNKQSSFSSYGKSQENTLNSTPDFLRKASEGSFNNQQLQFGQTYLSPENQGKRKSSFQQSFQKSKKTHSFNYNQQSQQPYYYNVPNQYQGQPNSYPSNPYPQSTPQQACYNNQIMTGRVVPYYQPQLQGQTYKQNSYYGTQNLQMSQCHLYLDLHLFKTEKCLIDPDNHNLKQCPFYHDYKKDRRRPLGLYQSEKCSFVERSDCPYGEVCNKAHNRVEEFYHPDKYKAKFCSSYLNGLPECEYGDFCSFAHSETELSVELIEKFEPDLDFYLFHFKSVWCPYREDDHERDVCVYAHNWQDYRRKPSIFTYSYEMCKNWDTKKIITSYQDGCCLGYQCLCSHGWKEQEFHPDFFKIKPCLHGQACEKPHCPYYHNEKDQKKPLSNWFKHFPKTRTISFPTNFYIPVLGNLTVLHKQTAFSRMATEMNCNFMLMQSKIMMPQSEQEASHEASVYNQLSQIQLIQQQSMQRGSSQNLGNFSMAQNQMLNSAPFYGQQMPQYQSPRYQSGYPLQNQYQQPMQQNKMTKFNNVNNPYFRKYSDSSFYSNQMSFQNALMYNQQLIPQYQNMHPMSYPQIQYNQQMNQHFSSPYKTGFFSSETNVFDSLTNFTNYDQSNQDMSSRKGMNTQTDRSMAESLNDKTPIINEESKSEQKIRKISCQSADNTFNQSIFYYEQRNKNQVKTTAQTTLAQKGSSLSFSSSPTQHQKRKNTYFVDPKSRKWQDQLGSLTVDKNEVEEKDEYFEDDLNSESDFQPVRKSRANSKSIDLNMLYHEKDVLLLLEEQEPGEKKQDQPRKMPKIQQGLLLLEIEQFLQKHGLSYLIDCFDGSLSLKDLVKMDEAQLQNILQGEMYVKTLKEKLNLLNQQQQPENLKNGHI